MQANLFYYPGNFSVEHLRKASCSTDSGIEGMEDNEAMSGSEDSETHKTSCSTDDNDTMSGSEDSETHKTSCSTDAVTQTTSCCTDAETQTTSCCTDAETQTMEAETTSVEAETQAITHKDAETNTDFPSIGDHIYEMYVFSSFLMFPYHRNLPYHLNSLK